MHQRVLTENVSGSKITMNNSSAFQVFHALLAQTSSLTYTCQEKTDPIRVTTRSSADADNGLDAFVGQSRSTNILGPFQVK